MGVRADVAGSKWFKQNVNLKSESRDTETKKWEYRGLKQDKDVKIAFAK